MYRRKIICETVYQCRSWQKYGIIRIIYYQAVTSITNHIAEAAKISTIIVIIIK